MSKNLRPLFRYHRFIMGIYGRIGNPNKSDFLREGWGDGCCRIRFYFIFIGWFCYEWIKALCQNTWLPAPRATPTRCFFLFNRASRCTKLYSICARIYPWSPCIPRKRYVWRWFCLIYGLGVACGPPLPRMQSSPPGWQLPFLLTQPMVNL